MFELLLEYDKCVISLRHHEKAEDFKSRHFDPNVYVSSLPMLKTATESYTRDIFAEFEMEFKEHFPLICTLVLQ
jgi:hypothetical protein